MAKANVDLNLQDLCVVNIIKHLPFYVQIYRDMIKEAQGEYSNSNLYRLHIMFSERIIALLRDRRVISDADCPSAQNTIINFNFGNEGQVTEENYLAFFLNPKLKELDIGFEKPRRKFLEFDTPLGEIETNGSMHHPRAHENSNMRPFLVTRTFWNVFLNVGKNLRVINMQGCDIQRDEFAPFLVAIPHVVHLNLSHTSFSDFDMPIIRHNCPLLRRLELAATDITDNGIRYFCEADSERGHERKNRLVFLNVHSTQITLEGAKNILISFPSLEIFQYFAPDMFRPIYPQELDELIDSVLRRIPITMGNAGLPSILHEMHKPCPATGEVLNVKEYKLKELVVGLFEQTEEILQTVLLSCPALTSLKILPAVTAQGLLLCSKFPNMKQIELHLGQTVPAAAMKEFFSRQGPKLEVVSFAPRSLVPVLGYADILNCVIKCPTLKTFSCRGIVLESYSRVRCALLYPLPLLTEINISYLYGSAATDFLSFLLCAAPNVTHLRLVDTHVDVDRALTDAKALHSFHHLQNMELLRCAVSLETVIEFYTMETVQYLQYSP